MPLPAPAFSIRPATPTDMRAAFAIFRRSIMAYVHRLGIVESPAVSKAMLDESWALRGPWIEHLWHSSVENWIAEDAEGRPVGWAMSIQRDDHLELTHFFVDPGAQSRGIGGELLAHALPADRPGRRSVIATQDPRAMSRYLRAGLRYITAIVDLENAPRRVAVDTDLDFERLDASHEAVALIGSIEEVLLGGRRDLDIRFILGQRPAWIARRAGAPVAFAFGDRGDELTGPIGALSQADVPALLAHVETEAAVAGSTNIYFSTPFDNHAAVAHLLGRGFTLDPMLVLLFADGRWLKTDRWIHTGLSYIL